MIGYEDPIGYEDSLGYSPAAAAAFVSTLTPRTVTLQADLATIPDPAYVTARTVVALPPSILDPGTFVEGTLYDATTTYDANTRYYAAHLFEHMRVYVDGVRVLRAYDTGEPAIHVDDPGGIAP